MILNIDTEELVSEVVRRVRESLGTNEKNSPALLTRKAAAQYLGISVRTFDKLDLPRVCVTETCYRFRRSDLDRFAAERVQD